jgi:hypothetical protein
MDNQSPDEPDETFIAMTELKYELRKLALRYLDFINELAHWFTFPGRRKG